MKTSRLLICIVLMLFAVSTVPAQTTEREITVDASAATKPFPHYWEKMYGSGRAILSLRDSYRRDLDSVHQATGFQYIRFHAILHDEVGVYDEDAQGNPVYNWSYVDQIYDGLKDHGIRPFVEVSFMPRKLAAADAPHAFWYKQNVAPPKDWKKWDDLIAAFGRHLVERYGIDEVAQWYFEVWNEPNIDFWVGDPKQPTYFELYDHTARALKKVDVRLRVGGPATAQAAWVDDFIRHCAENHVPVDFVSTHVYGNDTAADVFGTHEEIPRETMVCRAVRKVHDQVKASAMPDLPIEWSEYNASYKNEPEITDSTYMGPWLANTVRLCDGMVDTLSYWAFSDVFEEQGVVKEPFYGGYGLIAADNIPKPAFNAFALLHRLGDQRIDIANDSALVTVRSDGTIVMALWNLSSPGSASGRIKLFRSNSGGSVCERTPRYIGVDPVHGNVIPAYDAMGKPRWPTQDQIRQLRTAAALPPPEPVNLNHGMLSLKVPAQGLAVVEIR